MVATPFVQKVDAAGKEVWPEVKLAMEIVDRSLLEASGIAEDVWPRVEHYIANGDGAARKRRKVCEETVWALARLGWLRTGGERAVICRAIDFVRLDDEVSDETFAAIETELVKAVQSLPDYPEEN